MRSLLNSSVGKLVISATVLLTVLCYLTLASREFLAAYFAAKKNLRGVQIAIRLEPGDADYRYQLGRYYWFVQRTADAAIPPYQAAIRLNPFEARSWFDLAAIYQYLSDAGRQENALQHAVEEDPTTPDVAWEAANLYAVQGQTDQALKEFRVVLENDPYRPPTALAICWRIDPDIDALLRDVVPPDQKIYARLLEYLLSKKETTAAASVWAAMAKLGQPVERGFLLAYMRYLVMAGEVNQARLVWQQAANLCQLSAYQPSTSNLVVNGDFSLNVLNGGFDWFYRQSKDVSLALDPTQPHSGTRSLRIILDSRGMEDAGLQHLIPVQPNTTYEFSANFRSQDTEGAGGPRFVLQDLYSGTPFFSSDALTDADFWKSVSGDLTTGPDTKLLLLRLQRFPIGSPIKGTYWIDGIRLTAKSGKAGGKR
jgi:hypothetical protein